MKDPLLFTFLLGSVFLLVNADSEPVMTTHKCCWTRNKKNVLNETPSIHITSTGHKQITNVLRLHLVKTDFCCQFGSHRFFIRQAFNVILFSMASPHSLNSTEPPSTLLQWSTYFWGCLLLPIDSWLLLKLSHHKNVKSKSKSRMVKK